MRVNCKHWKDCGVQNGGCCALGKYGGRPSEGTCLIACLKTGPKMPSLWQMFKNLLGTIKGAIIYYIQYRELLASRLERKRRLAICQTCGFFEPEHNRCRKCGCSMKAKVVFQAAECKLELW